MKYLKAFLASIWKVWFYTSILLAILLLFPFIFIAAQKESWYPKFFFFARIWAWIILILSGVFPQVKWFQKPEKNKLYIICPNHTSMLDIMMTLALFPNCFVFIGKKELSQFPLFGYFYKRTNILVDRKSLRSRREVFDRAGEKIEQEVGLCIFPEGGVPDEEIQLAAFKNGAFKLAVDKQIPIIPVSYLDHKKRMPFVFWRGSPGLSRIIVHPFLLPQAKGDSEMERLKEACRKQIEESLLENRLAKDKEALAV